MPFRSPALSRRSLLGGIPALAGMLGARGARASVGAGDRRFLFIFVDGGWDPTWVFLPGFDNPNIDMPPDGSDIATAGDLRWVSGPGRPRVDAFFEEYGSRACVINGLEVRSIAHERCRRLLMTGSSAASSAGIPTLLAAGDPSTDSLGHVVLSGPAFRAEGGGDLVRVGVNGQLTELLDGSCVDGTTNLRLPSTDLAALEDAFVADQVSAGIPGRGAESRLWDGYGSALDRLDVARSNSDLLTGGFGDTSTELTAAVRLLGQGLARCAIVADLGDRNERWDHHADLSRQIRSYDTLFDRIHSVCRMLSSERGQVAETLFEEVTVVVVSEMGRAPRLNSSMGKDHWMTTSAVLIGGGIRGGQVFGGYNEAMAGALVHPETGELGTTDGVVLQPGHLGATLMQLAGIDPEPLFGTEQVPLTGVLS